MGLTTIVLFPVVAVTWVLTAAVLRTSSPASALHRWVDRYRWWLAWPILAVYLGALLGWLVLVAVLLVGAVAYIVNAQRRPANRASARSRR